MIDSPGPSETSSQLKSSLDEIAAQLMLDVETIHPHEDHSSTDLSEVSELSANLIDTLPDGDSTAMLDSIAKLQVAVSRSEEIHQTHSQAIEEADHNRAIPLEPSCPSPTSLSSDPELVAEFIHESREHLSSLEAQLLALENDAANTGAVHSIFRSFHSIKGLAGFLDFPAIQAVAHEVETLLDFARNGQVSIDGPVVDVILESADYLKQEIDRIEAQLNGRPMAPAPESGELILRVQALMLPASESLEIYVAQALAEPPPTLPVEGPADDPFKDSMPSEAGPDPVLEPASGPLATVALPQSATWPSVDRRLETEAAHFIKIDTAKLDFLVDMVGELVISQSILQHDEYLANATNPKLMRSLSQLSRITADVQKTALSMRMVPIGQLFRRSVRLVRDLTRKSGKRVELNLAGEDTELDRTLVEDLADPLMHMIRNAADHGIEPPNERIAKGKTPVASISLKAFHQAGHITIQLSDDGRGLDREKILRKATERGLVSDNAPLGDNEVYNLIFEPGFSTAEKVTDVSGRGVGMDVVRRHVQKLRGRIEIQSTPGQGTTFSITLPLTLAIIDGLVVAVGTERYIVPIYAVREMFRPSADKVFTVEGKAEMLLVRGSLLPVVRLHKIFGIVPKSYDAVAGTVVVAESGESRFCLLVDDMLGKQEVVIKSLGETLKKVRGIAGGAILGDGRVGLILDINAVYGDRMHAEASAS